MEAIMRDHCQQTGTEFRNDVFNHAMKMYGVTQFERMYNYISFQRSPGRTPLIFLAVPEKS